MISLCRRSDGNLLITIDGFQHIVDVAGRIDKGEPVTAPGIPADYPDPSCLVTDDCIRPLPTS